jgi:hypothetical protein
MNVIRYFKGFATGTICALAFGFAVAASAQTVLIDFGNDASFRGATSPSPDSKGNFWNSMRTGVFYQNLVDIQNAATTIDFGFSTGVATDSYNGPAGPTEPIVGIPESSNPHYFIPFTDIDQDALGNMGGSLEAAFDYVAGPSLATNNQVRFEIQQLDPAKKYDLSFFGSHKHSDNANTIYNVYSDNTYTTLVGTANLNVQNPANPAEHNRDTIATISNLSPQTSNILYVEFVGSSGDDGYLNILRIVATTPALTGDYNSNGKVDAADYVVWREALNTTTVLPNDPTGGTITTTQYNTWRANFGNGGAGSAAAVPEPSASLLVLIAAGIGGISSARRYR